MTPKPTSYWLVIILVWAALIVLVTLINRAFVKSGVVTQTQMNRVRVKALVLWFIIMISFVVGWYVLHGR